MSNRLFSDAQKTYSVAIKFTNSNINKMVRLVENNPGFIKSRYNLLKYPLWVNAFVEELYCFSSIRSIPEVGIPPISEEDDEYIRLQKTLNYEWATSRFELYLYLGNSKGITCELGRAALKNSQGYPYRRHRLIDLLTDNTSYLLGEGDWIGAKLDTFALPLGASDTITITGNWKQEIILVPEQQFISNVINVAAPSASPSPSATPTPPPTDITTTKQVTNNDTAGTGAYVMLSDTNLKRKSLSVKWISGTCYIVLMDKTTTPNSATLTSTAPNSPAGLFTGYTGRVTLSTDPGTSCTAEVTETSSP